MSRKGITARDLMPHLAEKGQELSLKPGEAVKRLKAMRMALVRLAKETEDGSYRRDLMAIDEAIEVLSGKA